MPVSAKDIKLLRSKQQREQNIKHEQSTIINDLTTNYGLVAPSLADYQELERWVRLQHRRLSEVKAEREHAMQDNNRRLEQIEEEIRVSVSQALERLAEDRKVLNTEYQARLDKEQQVLTAESERINEKHRYLISSNKEVLREAKSRLSRVTAELAELQTQASMVASGLAGHKARNDARRQQAVEITRMRQQAKKDKQVLMSRLRTACAREEEALADLQANLDMYPESRRRINEDYYNWIADVSQTKDDIAVLEAEIDRDELDNIFAASGLNTSMAQLVDHDVAAVDATASTGESHGGASTASTTGSSAAVRQESLDMLKTELHRLETEDPRQNPDDRYRALDADKQRWIKESTSHKRQLSRLRSELEQAGVICPDAVTLDKVNRLSPQELEEEARLDREYQHLKTRRQQLELAIASLSEEQSQLEEQVATARRVLDEEREGLGQQLQEQWDRCQARWSTMQARAEKWLAGEKEVIKSRSSDIKELRKKLEMERQELQQRNMALGAADSRCPLNNDRITAAIQCLDKLQRLL